MGLQRVEHDWVTHFQLAQKDILVINLKIFRIKNQERKNQTQKWNMIELVDRMWMKTAIINILDMFWKEDYMSMTKKDSNWTSRGKKYSIWNT